MKKRKTIYRLVPSKDVLKFLAKQDNKTRSRLIKAMETLQTFPPNGDIKPLKGTKGLFRLRIGSFRIIFYFNHDKRIAYISILDNRGGVYK